MLMMPRTALIGLCIDLGLFKSLALVCAVSRLFAEVTGDSRTTMAYFNDMLSQKPTNVIINVRVQLGSRQLPPLSRLVPSASRKSSTNANW